MLVPAPASSLHETVVYVDCYNKMNDVRTSTRRGGGVEVGEEKEQGRGGAGWGEEGASEAEVQLQLHLLQSGLEE